MTLAGVGPGDEVILPSISFVGAANAVMGAGARPVFCDVDPGTLNVTASTIEAVMTDRTRAFLPIHYGGLPCEMEPILELAARRRIAVIEDSACSVASKLRGKACGTMGDVGVWSFDAMKILVTGDGGMVYCRDLETARRAGQWLYLGVDGGSGFSNTAETRWWEFDVHCPGRRSITNDIAAAIGLEQLKKLGTFVARRKTIHECYDTWLREFDWLKTPPPVPPDSESSYYLYWIRTGEGRRDRLARHLRDRGIYTTFRYYPLHRLPLYGSTARLPQAEQAAEETLCLPIHQSLSDADLDRILDSLRSFTS
jgi:aminotransferase